MTGAGKYDSQAEGWSERSYANLERYLRHRADLVVELGPTLEPGDLVLDLACGDAGLAEPLLARGLRYRGIDASEEMTRAARERLGGRAEAEVGDLNEYRPREPVAATSCFRAIYYAQERRAFFRRVAEYTERKLVFDLNPRQYRVDEVRSDLALAGFERIDLRPFLVPQTRTLPGLLAAGLEAAERTPLARLALLFRFTYIVAASRRGDTKRRRTRLRQPPIAQNAL